MCNKVVIEFSFPWDLLWDYHGIVMITISALYRNVGFTYKKHMETLPAFNQDITINIRFSRSNHGIVMGK
jgi:hypothetical protein